MRLSLRHFHQMLNSQKPYLCGIAFSIRRTGPSAITWSSRGFSSRARSDLKKESTMEPRWLCQLMRLWSSGSSSPRPMVIRWVKTLSASRPVPWEKAWAAPWIINRQWNRTPTLWWSSIREWRQLVEWARRIIPIALKMQLLTVLLDQTGYSSIVILSEWRGMLHRSFLLTQMWNLTKMRHTSVTWISAKESSNS